jgi:hypothetical protein
LRKREEIKALRRGYADRETGKGRGREEEDVEKNYEMRGDVEIERPGR